MSKDLFFAVFLIALVITGLVVAGSFPRGFGEASSDVGGIVGQDTTWTPSGSPYTLSNDTLVNQGVTLTIQPGVTVNLGSHSIEINGTLTAQGSSNSPIKFNSGAISFTSYCNGYNKQTGLGCSIENSILNATKLLCDNTTKINQCIITAPVKGEFGIISFSNIMGEVSGDVVSTSTIKGDVSATTILNNNITGSVRQFASAQNNNLTGTVNIAGNCILSNNFIQGNITISSGTSTISSNTISSINNAINLDPSSSMGYIETTIKNNKITAAQVGIDIESDITPVLYGWSSRATILLNAISGCSTAGIFVNSEDNQATNTYSSGNKATIMENVISNNTYGIQANPPSLIQGNLIVNNQYGILGGIITDNTIVNNSYGVLGTNCTYNNIQNNSQYNFALGEFGSYSLTGNADATNNWWGTNDTQDINQTIYDRKNDSTLGNVTYEPFLISPNSAAPTQDYTIAAGSTLTPLTAPSPSLAPPSNTSPTPTSSPTTTTSPPRTTTNPEYIAAIILAIVIALGILAFLLVRRKRLHERF